MGTQSDISLLDSGNCFKLERYGQYTLVRPSSLAIWHKRLPEKIWNQADATYDPDSGWSFSKSRFETWDVNAGGCSLRLRLQTNGQIGLFPEHLSYLSEIERDITALKNLGVEKPSVLNLFAYTGLATLTCAKLGAAVQHIDLSKRALDWTSENLEINGLTNQSVRLIPEDALKIVEREERRESKFDLIIADPPSFSRISKTRTWDIDVIIEPFLRSLVGLLNPERSALYVTSHHDALSHYVLTNLLADSAPHAYRFGRDLVWPEKDPARVLPAGSFSQLRIGALAEATK